jgi:hypothetical protein
MRRVALRFLTIIPLADEAVVVDDHGPGNKAQVVKNTSEFRLADYTSQETAAR